MKRILAAGVLALVMSGSVLAQSGLNSNTSGPGGGGGGVGGSVGANIPNPTGLTGLGSGGNIGARLADARGNSPMAAANRLIGGTMTGTAGSSGNYTQALITGGVGSGPAAALALAMGAFGAAPTLANLQAACRAFNEALKSQPAGTRLSPTMRATRAVLLRLGSRSGSRP